MSKMTRFKYGLPLAAATLLSASPGNAALTWNLAPSGTGAWDWTFTPQGFFTYSSGTMEDYYGQSVNDLSLTSFPWNPAAPECIELSTAPGLETANPDTRIWIEGSATNPTGHHCVPGSCSINDDFNGTLQSKARIWLPGSAVGQTVEIFIEPYSPSGDGDTFNLIVTRRDLTQAQCTTGQTTIPWAVYNSGSQITLSPNAT
jgi:hypothetical protein